MLIFCWTIFVVCNLLGESSLDCNTLHLNTATRAPTESQNESSERWTIINGQLTSLSICLSGVLHYSRQIFDHTSEKSVLNLSTQKEIYKSSTLLGEDLFPPQGKNCQASARGPPNIVLPGIDDLLQCMAPALWVLTMFSLVGVLKILHAKFMHWLLFTNTFCLQTAFL